MIILKVITENGEELLADVDDEAELNHIYDLFMEDLFSEDERTTPKTHRRRVPHKMVRSVAD